MTADKYCEALLTEDLLLGYKLAKLYIDHANTLWAAGDNVDHINQDLYDQSQIMVIRLDGAVRYMEKKLRREI